MKYPLVNTLLYDNILASYRIYLAKFSFLVKPKTFKKTAKDNRWIQAMKLEIQDLEENKTWEVIDLSQGKTSIGSMIGVSY